MDRFREMETFVRVVESGSFVGAAEALRSSKAAVSRSVQELEGRLGARLLNRTTRRQSLTEAGRAYYERCRQILDEVEEADGMVSLSSNRAVGQLKVNAPLTFGVRHLAPLWGRFLETHPEVTLDVALNDRMVDLLEEGYDLAIRITRMADSSLVYRRLATSRLELCASPEYLAAYGTPQEVADLARHRVITYSYAARGDHWQFDTPAGPQAVNIRPHLRANNGDTCRAAALDHQGIILQPTFIVGDDLAAGTLVPILPQVRREEVGIHAVYPSRKHLSAKVRALVDFLAAWFDGVDWERGTLPAR